MDHHIGYKDSDFCFRFLHICNVIRLFINFINRANCSEKHARRSKTGHSQISTPKLELIDYFLHSAHCVAYMDRVVANLFLLVLHGSLTGCLDHQVTTPFLYKLIHSLPIDNGTFTLFNHVDRSSAGFDKL